MPAQPWYGQLQAAGRAVCGWPQLHSHLLGFGRQSRHGMASGHWAARLAAVGHVHSSSWRQLPLAFSSLGSLTPLNLTDNQRLIFDPALLAPLQHLAVLEMEGALPGAAPRGMSALHPLTSLTLDHINSRAEFCNLIGLPRLQRLSLMCLGKLHVLFEGLGALTWLYLGAMAQGAVGSLASLSSLRELELSTAPGLPAGIRALAHLTKLGLDCGTSRCPAEDVQWLVENFGGARVH
jgi:hypothetical protein